MDKQEFDLIVSRFPIGSVKRACYIIKEYVRCEKLGKLESCAVTKKEFDDALKIVVAFSYKESNDDTMPEQWMCDSDCLRNNGADGFCPGEFQIENKKTKRMCKHYWDSSNV